MRAAKRSFSSSFNPYGKSDYGRGAVLGNAAKRPRVASTATNASSSMDDPIGQYLAEMVDIERQWLEMERERAENERAMMMCEFCFRFTSSILIKLKPLPTPCLTTKQFSN